MELPWWQVYFYRGKVMIMQIRGTGMRCSIVQNHSFLDGNKRTGAAAAIVFLAVNDIDIEADEDGLVNLTLSMAMGSLEKLRLSNSFAPGATDPRPAALLPACRKNSAHPAIPLLYAGYQSLPFLQ